MRARGGGAAAAQAAPAAAHVSASQPGGIGPVPVSEQRLRDATASPRRTGVPAVSELAARKALGSFLQKEELKEAWRPSRAPARASPPSR